MNTEVQELRAPALGRQGRARLGVWFRGEGEPCARGEILYALHIGAELAEVTAASDGILLRRMVGEDDEVQPGDVMGLFATDGEASPGNISPDSPLPSGDDSWS